MKLIEQEVINGRICRYYDGIDFDIVKSHARDGSDGLIVCLIESFIKEIKNLNRDRRIKSILQNESFNPFDTDEMTHDFVGIYQYEGVGFDTMFNIVRKQIREYGNDLYRDTSTDQYH